MKIRLDFVTNSSTSSFICEVCGDVQVGWDLCLSEAEMMECVNSHVVCQSHLAIEAGDRLDEVRADEDAADEFPYNVPSELCPICSLKHVRDKDMLDYVLQFVAGLFPEKEAVGKEIRKTFNNLEELKGWCSDENKK